VDPGEERAAVRAADRVADPADAPVAVQVGDPASAHAVLTHGLAMPVASALFSVLARPSSRGRSPLRLHQAPAAIEVPVVPAVLRATAVRVVAAVVVPAAEVPVAVAVAVADRAAAVVADRVVAAVARDPVAGPSAIRRAGR
jgi:hypothetical protein